MNKARITYRFDQDRERFDRLAADSKNEKHGTSHDASNSDLERENREFSYKEFGDSERERTEIETKHDLYDSQMLNQFTTDYGAWSSPFDIETERLERLIRESDYMPEDESDKLDGGRRSDLENSSYNSRSVSEPGSEQADSRSSWSDGTPLSEPSDNFSRWADMRDERKPKSSMRAEDRIDILLDEEDHHQLGPIIDEQLRSPYTNITYRPGGPGGASWFRIITSAIGAVATGVLFGLFIMQMFTNLALSPDAPPVSIPQSDEGDAGSDEAALPLEPPGTEQSAATAIAVDVPPQTVYMLQFGVFSSKEGADAAQEQLRRAGIASAYEAGDQHIVYAGVTPDRNSALLLSSELDGLELETYVKPYERPAIRSLHWGGAEAAQIENYLTGGAGLARTISLLTLVHLEETVLTNFEDATMQALSESHQRWLATVSQIASDVPEAGEAIFEQMNNELTTAVNSLLEYRKNPSVSYLWQAQTAVMKYVILEKQLLMTLSA